MDYYEKYLSSALHFLGYRPRSEKEVLDNLYKKLNRFKISDEQKQAAEQAIARVIQFLREQKFINDEEFVRWWVESRMRFKQRSRWVILKELQTKGISKEFAEKVLEKEGAPEIDDLTQARILVKKRIRKYKDLPKQEIYKKLGMYLGGKGFSWEIIKRGIDDVLDTEYNTDKQ